VEKYGRAGQGTDDNMAHAFAGYLRLQTHIQNVKCLLLFHCNNGCTIAPQCHAVRMLPVFLKGVLGAGTARDCGLHVYQFRSRVIFTG
jgi:hypothetical protein